MENTEKQEGVWVLSRDPARSGWSLAVCHCGALFSARNDRLKAGKTVSCGCAFRERSARAAAKRAALQEARLERARKCGIAAKERHNARVEKAEKRAAKRAALAQNAMRESKVGKVVEGEKFGRLTVVADYSANFPDEKDPNPPNSRVIWLCECECGNLTTRRADKLAYAKRPSCGCGRLIALRAQLKRLEGRLEYWEKDAEKDGDYSAVLAQRFEGIPLFRVT